LRGQPASEVQAEQGGAFIAGEDFYLLLIGTALLAAQLNGRKPMNQDLKSKMEFRRPGDRTSIDRRWPSTVEARGALDGRKRSDRRE
jgi:hypothetical protein